MPTAQSVQEILDLLHIDIIGIIESIHDQIREHYHAPPLADDFEHFKAITTDYMRHHSSLWYGLQMPDNMAWGRIREVLDGLPHPEARLSRVRGYLDSQGGYVSAVKNAMTGRHGGLIAVIDGLAAAMKEEGVRQWVQSVFLTCINPMDYEAKVFFALEYLELYGHLLIPEEDLLSPYELAGQLETLLETHMRVINQLRNVVQ